ncbi:hypothetical protein [Brachybacterium aquaticum]|uniref:Uncharacterized protein n=1 Tax=Brachybacterium aquaticum TaxID=1432564 RepID=A0A841A8J4_9MICO|nr:hypothetical protein [Brachybacterium aquaticum]MBB5830253.1 hypothetical protein [Brachybacterium aquaticum]
MKRLRALRPTSASQAVLALVPALIAAGTLALVIAGIGDGVLIAAAGAALALLAIALWQTDRRSEARRALTNRQLAAIREDVAAADRGQRKELSRVLYFVGSGPHTKATVGNIRKDLHRVHETVTRLETVLDEQSLRPVDDAAGRSSSVRPRRAPSQNRASVPLKHDDTGLTAGRIAASVAPDPHRRRRLCALLEQTSSDAETRPLVQTIALPGTLARLQNSYSVRALRPDLLELDPGTSFLVIESRALHSGIWHGTLHASHARRYRALRDLLLAARKNSVLVILLEDDDATWHFDAELRDKAHLTLRPGEQASGAPWASDRPLDIVSTLSE